MSLDREVKQAVVSQHARHAGDSGSPEVQIALLTSRIQMVAAHLREHKLDKHGRRGLVLMVGKRNRLLRYLQRTNEERYRATIAALGLRK